MPVNRDLWNSYIIGGRVPPWPCPRCTVGILKTCKDSFESRETLSSRATRSDPEADPSNREYVFSCCVECIRCKEVISVGGIGSIEPIEDYDEQGLMSFRFSNVYVPLLFSQPMRLLPLDWRYPEKIRALLDRSFFLVFCDPNAASNYIRQCAEEILSLSGIPKTSAKGGFITLQQRIDMYSSTDSKNAERISALRYIGNVGSHEASIVKKDVFDLYDILEVLLSDLYIQHIQSIDKMVLEINTNKGPLKKTKPKDTNL